jgi:hypothetical protein
LAERWGVPPWEIVEGCPDDRGWSRAAWVDAQAVWDAAERVARERLRRREGAA